jgi:DNA polymerase-3 subunit epsilon
MYAIVDIETTGGGPSARITEIAIYRYDGCQVLDHFQTLVNPKIFIPPFITNITGINNEMVADAPTFEEVKDSIRSITQDAWFVAHNSKFDYGFVKNEFEASGEIFQRNHLCTVQLSRKIFPGLQSYSLGKLCTNLNIQIKNRHRADGDAAATVKLFEMLLNHDQNSLIPKPLMNQIH